MKKLALMVLFGLVLSACGGSDFVGMNVVPEQDAASDTADAGQPDVLQEGTQEASAEVSTDADAALQEAGEDVDAALPDADAADPEASTDAQVEPDAAIEAGDEKGPDICAPTSCQAQGKNCGPIPDGCGGNIASCGTCPANQLCGGGGVPSVCGGCTPTSCLLQGKDCGTIQDGCGNTLPCGVCSSPETCGGGGVANTCGCTPTTCQLEGKNCGTISDKCGGTLACGPCPGNATCGGGGVPNVCGGCVPDLCLKHGYNCGMMPDGCGNTLNCGKAFLRYPQDMGCGAYYPWSCGGVLNYLDKGPMPFPDCVQMGLAYMYCCPESS